MLPGYVECSNGSFRHEDDVFTDCRDNPHASESDRNAADVEIVREVLTAISDGADAYCTENEDYATGCIHIVSEVSHEWPARIKEWDADYHPDDVIDAVCEEMDGGFDCEVEYDRSEHDRYTGPGCCLYSLDIGEHEEQIDLSCHDELKELHLCGRLDDVLDELDRDFCISRSRRRVKNDKTGCYEEVGRKTYDCYGSDHPTLTIYTLPGGQWHYVVPAKRMKELFREAGRRNRIGPA